MRVMVMHKVNASMEAGELPGAELIARMGELIGGGFKSGVVVDGAGLRPTSTRVRLTCAAGACTARKGPLTGDGHVIAGFAMVRVKSLDDAVTWGARLGAALGALGDEVIDVGPVNEPWDIGAAPRPAGEVPLRCLILYKDGQAERGQPASPQRAAALAGWLDDMKKAGVLLGAQALAPSAKSTRLSVKGGKRTVVDGPFTESKELIAGFATIDVSSREEAIAWATRYAEIIGEVEVDLRPLAP
jgi:hypothetical protein